MELFGREVWRWLATPQMRNRLRGQLLPAHLVGDVPRGGLSTLRLQLPTGDLCQHFLQHRVVAEFLDLSEAIGHAGRGIGLAVFEADGPISHAHDAIRRNREESATAASTTSTKATSTKTTTAEAAAADTASLL